MSLQISLSTLVGAGTLLASPQEDRSEIRDAQDLELWHEVASASRRLLTPGRKFQARFCVAPLDLIPLEEDGRQRFQFTELNGTGIGGLTNLPESSISAILNSIWELAEFAAAIGDSAPVILIGMSGMQSRGQPRPNRLAYEKLLYAEALVQGFARCGRRAEVLSLDVLRERLNGQPFQPTLPTIVIGYMKAFLPHLHAEAGRLNLAGAAIAGVINDRFFQNILHALGGQIDLTRIVVANPCFAAGSDKGTALSILNDFMAQRGEEFPLLRPRSEFRWAQDSRELGAEVARWLRERRTPVVVKPHATGGGDGIEFFLDLDESEAAISDRLRVLAADTEDRYGVSVFPYTLCEFIDGCTFAERAHRFHGHKYDRIVAYREGPSLLAFPSIIKFSSEPYDRKRLSRMMLINNITAGAAHTGSSGHHFMLPLCRRESLRMLQLSAAQLIELCRFATEYVQAVIERLPC